MFINSVLLRFPGFKRKAVTFSYDDDCIYNIRLKDMFDGYGVKCTFNLNGGLFPPENSGKYSSAKEMYNLLADSPHEIALHGYHHLTLTQTDNATAAYDVLHDRMTLEKMFGRIIKGFAYGNGKFDDRICGLLKEIGIRYARTTVGTGKFDFPENWLAWHPTCHHSDKRLFEYFENFIRNTQRGLHDSDPLVFYVWGHSYEFNERGNWELMDEILSAVTAYKDEVYFASNGEIYEYVQAYKRLETSLDRKLVFNPNSMDLFLEINFENRLLRAGETLRIEGE